MPDPIKAYLKQVEAALAAGNATEHTHRPALKALVEALAPGVTAINEPQRIACGAPDFVVQRTDLTGFENLSGLFNLGYIEAKDVGKSLDEAERAEQLTRYRRALPNLVLTDYLEFRWYADGELRTAARLAHTGAGGKLTAEKGGAEAVGKLLGDFLAHQPAAIASPQLLAVRMARLAHLIRDIIAAAFDGASFHSAARLAGSLRQDADRRPGSAGEDGRIRRHAGADPGLRAVRRPRDGYFSRASPVKKRNT